MTVEETKSMKREDFIIAVFCRIDDSMGQTYSCHTQGSLYLSKPQTIGILFGLKGLGKERTFYQWLKRDYRYLFRRLPERTRLFRSLETLWGRCKNFMAPPTMIDVADSQGVERNYLELSAQTEVSAALSLFYGMGTGFGGHRQILMSVFQELLSRILSTNRYDFWSWKKHTFRYFHTT